MCISVKYGMSVIQGWQNDVKHLSWYKWKFQYLYVIVKQKKQKKQTDEGQVKEVLKMIKFSVVWSLLVLSDVDAD